MSVPVPVVVSNIDDSSSNDASIDVSSLDDSNIDVSSLDIEFPKTRPEVLEQMRLDRQEELDRAVLFNQEKAKAKAKALQAEAQQAETQGEMDKPKALGSSEATERKENNELEEMRLGEIGHYARFIYHVQPSHTYNTTSLRWEYSDKINQIKGDSIAKRTYLLDLLYGALAGDAGFWSKTYYNSAIDVIEARSRTKRGCDVNIPCMLPGLPVRSDGRYQRYSHYTPLKFAVTLAKINPEFAKDPKLIQSLITAGARFDVFDPKMYVTWVRSPFPIDLSKDFVLFPIDLSKDFVPRAKEELDYLTPLDVLMHRYEIDGFQGQTAAGVHYYDCYNMVGWRSTDPIPADFEKPAFRVFLKGLYLQAEFVGDNFDLKENNLREIFEKQNNLNSQVKNVFPDPLNALIFSYAAPRITDFRRLTCLKDDGGANNLRGPLFFRNVFTIGKLLYEADQMAEKVAECRGGRDKSARI